MVPFLPLNQTPLNGGLTMSSNLVTKTTTINAKVAIRPNLVSQKGVEETSGRGSRVKEDTPYEDPGAYPEGSSITYHVGHEGRIGIALARKSCQEYDMPRVIRETLREDMPEVKSARWSYSHPLAGLHRGCLDTIAGKHNHAGKALEYRLLEIMASMARGLACNPKVPASNPEG
ncbi:hypothetical protein VNO77_18998 [Canavalia gladiata]|uniref:Uncharacterized protein n=1 Tax=Canavalia gladiata TaxID=3824 RepID=A0AAN9QKY5_CANGL